MAALCLVSSASAVSCASAYADAHAQMQRCHLRKKRPENEPLWQPKIVYPTILM